MSKCEKCQTLYDAYMAHLDETIRYFENREKYRNQPIENEWSEERKKAYNENRINSLKIRKDFITNYFKQEGYNANNSK